MAIYGPYCGPVSIKVGGDCQTIIPALISFLESSIVAAVKTLSHSLQKDFEKIPYAGQVRKFPSMSLASTAGTGNIKEVCLALTSVGEVDK